MTTNDEVVKVSGAIPPGEYECIWTVDGREVPGSIELSGSRPPTGNIRMELPAVSDPDDPSGASRYPVSEERDRVDGFLTDRHVHIVLLNVNLMTWFPDTTSVDAAIALVGQFHRPPDQLVFIKMAVQVTQLDAFSGIVPIREYGVPRGDQTRWSATPSSPLSLHWKGTTADVTFQYASRMQPDGGYRLSVQFVPWIDVDSQEPLGVTSWLDRWCRPLVSLVATATSRLDRLTYMEVEAADGGKFTVFAHSITQKPYYATRPPHDRPIAFELNSPEFNLAQALERWNELVVDEHPLIASYEPALLEQSQHPRGRVLALLQWLEASYGFEHREDIAQQQARYTEKRAAVVERLTVLCGDDTLSRDDLKFIKGKLQRGVGSGLLDALRYYIARHVTLEMDRRLSRLPIVRERISKNEAEDPVDALRFIRNGLSHGSASYEAEELNALAHELYQLVRAEFIGCLGGRFDATTLASD